MRQQPLFPSPLVEPPPPAVPGLVVRPSYVGAAEEAALLAHVEGGPWQADFRRRVQIYGLGYGGPDSGSGSGSGSEPEDRSGALVWVRDFPPWLAALAQRVTADGFLPRPAENCVINDYAPGVGIGPHRDYPPFGGVIAAVSLISDVVVDFARLDGSARAAVVVPARSLWVASGEARWAWTHGIAARRSDVIEGERRKRGRRVSLTFRIARDAEAAARARARGPAAR